MKLTVTRVSDKSTLHYDGQFNYKEHCLPIKDNNLMVEYRAWRKAVAEVNEYAREDNVKEGSTDCGDQSAREDFSNFANLDKYVTYEVMLDLEERF